MHTGLFRRLISVVASKRNACLKCSNVRALSVIDMSAHVEDKLLQRYDSTQARLMQEECILINENDKKIGFTSKKTCHLMKNIDKGMLHRAFSVFLFNTDHELLVQQRSDAKITFPGHFTNTVCSHPLNVPSELDETDAIGVKRAAQRKLHHELGINPNQLTVKNLHFLTRIQYKSRNAPRVDDWGEHEIDYILIAKKDVSVMRNTNEVKSYRYVTREQLKQMIEQSTKGEILITPWFKLIVDNFLWKWWDNLNHLDTCIDKNIHRMC